MRVSCPCNPIFDALFRGPRELLLLRAIAILLRENSAFTMLDTKKYNALDLAQPTNFKAMLQSGEVLWGTSCRIPHEESARIVATLPHHFCFLDSVQKTKKGSELSILADRHRSILR